MRSLERKAIVITGAGQGIGKAAAYLAAEHGAAVVLNDINADQVVRVAADIVAKGGRAASHVADIASWAEAGRLIDRCVLEFGQIDGLLNNAAILRMAPLVDLDERDVRAMVEVNVVGNVACMVHAARHMVKRGTGSIVNMSSGIQAGFVAQGLYGATKGAMSSITYAAALELGNHGVRCNAVSPMAGGPMRAVVDAFYQSKSQANANSDPVPSPESNAPLIVYLLSDRSSSVNGQFVRINGKQLALMTHPAILEPVLIRDLWDVDAIDDAFRDTLSSHLQPLGLVRQTVQHSV